jgi:hypothetical protein
VNYEKIVRMSDDNKFKLVNRNDIRDLADQLAKEYLFDKCQPCLLYRDDEEWNMYYYEDIVKEFRYELGKKFA